MCILHLCIESQSDQLNKCILIFCLIHLHSNYNYVANLLVLQSEKNMRSSLGKLRMFCSYSINCNVPTRQLSAPRQLSIPSNLAYVGYLDKKKFNEHALCNLLHKQAILKYNTKINHTHNLFF